MGVVDPVDVVAKANAITDLAVNPGPERGGVAVDAFPGGQPRQFPMAVDADQHRPAAVAIAGHALELQRRGRCVEYVFQPATFRAGDGVEGVAQLGAVGTLRIVAARAGSGGALADDPHDFSHGVAGIDRDGLDPIDGFGELQRRRCRRRRRRGPWWQRITFRSKHHCGQLRIWGQTSVAM